MKVTVEFDSNDSNDVAALEKLFGQKPAVQAAEDFPTQSERQAPAKKAAAKKAAPKREPEPEPEDGNGDPMMQAVGRATALMKEGRAKDVKAALAAVGAKKVSELSGDDIVKFLEELG